MFEEPPDDETAAQHRRRPADGVRAGDTVVYTSKLNKEYRFEVTDVDDDWIAFRTGQMVHADRFEREDFEVVRSGEAAVASAEGRTAPASESGAAGRPTPDAE
jgi:hypothetical protein